MRCARLGALEENGPLSVEGALDALIRPLFEQIESRSEGWKSYLLILSKLTYTDQWQELVREIFDPTARLQPDIARPTRLCGFSLTLFAMLQTLAVTPV